MVHGWFFLSGLPCTGFALKLLKECRHFKIDPPPLELIGFQQLYRLPEYVLDMQSKAHDYVMLGMDLRVQEEYAGVG